jgi:hypothetical protein
MPVQESVEHVVSRHDEAPAGKGVDERGETLPGDVEAHETRTIIAALEKVACWIHMCLS